jgi:hypothetical protein
MACYKQPAREAIAPARLNLVQNGEELVMLRRALFATMVFGVSTIALAQTGGSDMGTPEQREACGPDVRRFCHKIKESDGQDAYLQCLEINRSKLSPKCIALLQSYGK